MRARKKIAITINNKQLVQLFLSAISEQNFSYFFLISPRKMDNGKGGKN